MSEPAVQLYSVADYLAFEQDSDIRHEYLAGTIHAMAGESKAHNAIVGNLYEALRGHLKGSPCRVFMETVKVNVQTRFNEIYYYPDIVVTCHPLDEEDPYVVRHPRLLIEVLSPGSKHKDEVEKYLAYQHLASLEEYLLVEQDNEHRQVRVLRKDNEWALAPEDNVQGNRTIRMSSIDLTLSLEDVYAV